MKKDRTDSVCISGGHAVKARSAGADPLCDSTGCREVPIPRKEWIDTRVANELHRFAQA